MSRSIRFSVLPLGLLTILAGCSSQPPPPQAVAQSPAPDPGATYLRDTIQKPINKAKGVEAIIMKSHDKQDQQLQNQENGDASPASQ